MALLKYKEDRRTLAFIAINFALAFTGYFLFQTASWAILIPLLIGTCCFTFFCAVTVHNSIHCPMFKNKTHNKLFQFVLSLSYGYSVSAFVPGHNFSHHKWTQTNKDNMRTVRMRFRWNLLNQLFFFFAVSGEIMQMEVKWVKKMYKVKRSWFYQWLAESVLVYTVKIGLLIYDWQAGLLFFWLPHMYGTWGIVGTNVWQHDGTDQSHPYNHSRSFTSPLLNFFVCNNGYHTVHHMRPGLHWSKLPAFHEKHVAPYAHPNVNRNSLLAYLWESYVWPGKRVDYLGNPIAVPEKTVSEDWIDDLKFKSKEHNDDFGVEAVNTVDPSDIEDINDQVTPDAYKEMV